MPGLFTRVLQFTLGPSPTPVEIARAQARSVLELGPHATKSDVRSAYRGLCRKYHPDRHARSPAKQKAATELTMRLSQAYNGIEEHLKET